MARVTPVTAVTRLAGDIWGVSAGYLQEFLLTFVNH